MAYALILTLVSPCTGECRLVRVITVLILSYTRTCVAFVLISQTLASRDCSGQAATTPSLQAEADARPARPDVTLCDEQTGREMNQGMQIADSARAESGQIAGTLTDR